ncbi:MAG: Bax inhibitor-1/YccA family protein [Planctomycetota bacterium]
MSALESRNPTLRAFEQPQRWADLEEREAKLNAMSYSGTITATAVLLSICASTAVLGWDAMTVGGLFEAGTLNPTFGMFGGIIGGLVLALVISFAPKLSPILGPVYAGVEGVFLAAFSLFIAERFLGGAESASATATIFQALVVTFAIAAGMLVGYATGIIRGGPIFNKIIITAGIGLVIYAVGLILMNGVFNMGIPNLYSSTTPLGIGFTAVCVILASLFLILDFQVVESGVKNKAPKYMEWYAAFGLLVTLVWLYVEVLRLLAKLKSE